MGIGNRIKEAREQLGLTQTELGELVGVTGSAITNYEKEISHPKEPVMYKLIEALKVDANYLFQDVVRVPRKSNDVTLAEYNMIKEYRNLDSYGQETVSYILSRETARVNALQAKDQRIATLESALNQSGAALRIYTYMHKIASAGTGFYFDDIPTDTIEAPYCEKADFIIGVDGDSMEPTFHDGDLVYVEKCQSINVGEIGIFTLNNECYIKEAGENSLLSHNPKYNDIPGTEQIVCVGRVLGKVTM